MQLAAMVAIEKQCWEDNKTFYHVEYQEDFDSDAVEEILRRHGLKVVSTLYHPQGGKDIYNTWGTNDTLAIMQNGISVYTSKKDLYDELVEFTKKASNASDRVFVISQGFGGSFDLKPINVKGIPLIKENYPKALWKDIEHLKEDLASDDPVGRLHIMIGPPGCGKSYLILQMLHEVDAKFIMVPQPLLSQLMSPGFTDLLINQHADGASKLILVLEDADHSLLQRGSDNLSELQAILNLSEGIIGGGLNLQVIATSNAAKVEIDPALKRNGRLGALLEFSSLDAAEASRVHKRLSGDEVTYDKPTTLADIYYRVHGRKRQDTKPKMKLGFG